MASAHSNTAGNNFGGEQDTGLTLFGILKLSDTLNISGNELIIYAIIHTYSTCGDGLFYGSQHTLASRANCSVRTAQRCLSSLLARGIIERVNIGGKCGVRAVPLSILREKAEKTTPPCNQSATAENDNRADLEKQQNADSVGAKTTAQHKENTSHKNTATRKDTTTCKDTAEHKDNFPRNPLAPPEVDTHAQNQPSEDDKEGEEMKKPSFFKSSEEYGHFKENPHELAKRIYQSATPRFELVPFGRKGYVSLTPEQYARLANLVDSETLTRYIAKMELLIEQKDYFIKNQYKTLRKWIVQDLGS